MWCLNTTAVYEVSMKTDDIEAFRQFSCSSFHDQMRNFHYEPTSCLKRKKIFSPTFETIYSNSNYYFLAIRNVKPTDLLAKFSNNNQIQVSTSGPFQGTIFHVSTGTQYMVWNLFNPFGL